VNAGPALTGDLLHLVLDGAHDLALFTLDAQRRVHDWSAGAERLLGHPASCMIGHDVGVLFAPDQPALALAGRTDTTVRLLRADGSCLHANLIARRLAHGGLGVLLRDVSERQRLQSEVAESQEQYRRLFQHNPYPTWVYCRDSLRFMDVNDAAIREYGWSRDEFLAMTLADIRPPEDVPALLAAIAQLRDTADGRGGPWRHRHKDGTIVEVEISFHTLPFKGKSARLVVADDVTERRRAEERRTRLLAKIVSAQEDERRRVARELHDAVGQSLTALTVGLGALEQSAVGEEVRRSIERLRGLAASTVREAQRLARGLRPSALDDLGLDAALSHHASDYADTHGIAVDYRAEGLNGGRLPHGAETAIYRITQEAMTNAARHAAARSIEVRLRRQPGAILLTVRDDGCGFVVEPDGQHLGIAGMRERAELLDGSFSIVSRPGEGTLVSVQLPIHP